MSSLSPSLMFARMRARGVTAMASLLDINDVVASDARLNVRRIGPADLRTALANGSDEFLSLPMVSFPFLIGLTVVFSILGPTTWHFYRVVVEPRCA